LFLPIERFFKALGRGPEQIFLIQPEVGHQASHGRGVVFYVPVAMNVFDNDSVLFEDSRNEYAAVTVEWFLFSTHNGDSFALRAIPQASDPIGKI
jgi:hypothetical protein